MSPVDDPLPTVEYLYGYVKNYPHPMKAAYVSDTLEVLRDNDLQHYVFRTDQVVDRIEFYKRDKPLLVDFNLGADVLRYILDGGLVGGEPCTLKDVLAHYRWVDANLYTNMPAMNIKLTEAVEEDVTELEGLCTTDSNDVRKEPTLLEIKAHLSQNPEMLEMLLAKKQGSKTILRDGKAIQIYPEDERDEGACVTCKRHRAG